MPIVLFALLTILSSCSVRQKLTVNSCGENGTISHGIIGTRHCRSISVSNGVIVRTEEGNSQLLKSVSVIKCPESYIRFGDIGTNGVILINTSEKIDYKVASSINYNAKSDLAGKRKIYFLNGFLITSDSLKISPNAIQRVEVLSARKYNDTTINDNTVLINIWTLTKKEVRKSKRKCSRSIM